MQAVGIANNEGNVKRKKQVLNNNEKLTHLWNFCGILGV